MALTTAVLVGCQVLALSAGQVLWKLGIDRAGGFLMPGHSLLDSIVRLMHQPAFLAGSALYIFSTGLWFYLLARHDLAFVYPMLSLTYVITVIGGWFILGETLSPMRLAAIGIIVIGVAVLTQT